MKKQNLNQKPKLKLINHKNTLGYTMSNIEKVFDEKEFAKFQNWIWGQTVAVYKKTDRLVYKHDFDRYLLGLPILD